MTDTDWTLDGHGLDPRSRELIAEHGGTVHARLCNPAGDYPRAACGYGVGEWWSGDRADVTCTACLVATR